MTDRHTIYQFPDDWCDLLVSIMPIHADRIYRGTKTFELRKALPRDTPRRIFLYETNRRGITGHVVIDKVISGPPEAVWRITGEAGTTKERFDDYFANRPIAHAFEISRSIKYANPVCAQTPETGEPTFLAPQNFLYLESLPALHRTLHKLAFSEALRSVRRPFVLRPIDPSNYERFLDLTAKHITGSYLETGRSYGRKLLQVHSDPNDSEGILSLSKTVLEIFLKRRLVGFAVLTEKIGGSIKTGPVILLKKYRSAGIGRKFRRQLHKVLSLCGYRKAYCTVPIVNKAAVGYLISSGYRIEAHLEKHYHQAHDELVFGFPLTVARTTAREIMRPITPALSISKLDQESSAAALFLQKEFCIAYCRMPEGWAAEQIGQAIARVRGEASFKPRQIFMATNNDGIQAAALCIHKRGGSTKLLLVTRTAHTESLGRLIAGVEADLARERGVKLRKIYTFVPVCDSLLQNAFYTAGYNSEGVLDRPYRSADDLLVLARLINVH